MSPAPESWAEIKSAVLRPNPQDASQHQDGTGHGEQEELDRGVDTPFSAPHADQEVHGDEGEFPEDVEKDHVQGEEDTQHAGFQQQEESHEAFDLLLHGFPGGKDGKRGQEGGQQDHQDADAIDTEVESRWDYRQGRTKAARISICISPSGSVELCEHPERQTKGDQGW